MKRFAAYAGIGIAIFALGILFTVGLGNYLASLDQDRPALRSPSTFGHPI